MSEQTPEEMYELAWDRSRNQTLAEVMKIIDKYFPTKGYKKHGVIGLTLSENLSLKQKIQELGDKT